MDKDITIVQQISDFFNKNLPENVMASPGKNEVTIIILGSPHLTEYQVLVKNGQITQIHLTYGKLLDDWKSDKASSESNEFFRETIKYRVSKYQEMLSLLAEANHQSGYSILDLYNVLADNDLTSSKINELGKYANKLSSEKKQKIIDLIHYIEFNYTQQIYIESFICLLADFSHLNVAGLRYLINAKLDTENIDILIDFMKNFNLKVA